MTRCAPLIAPVVAWLRRPAELVAQTTAFLQTHGITSLEGLEHTLSRLGIPLIPATLSSNTYGLATRDQGETLIYITPHMNPLHREWTVVHEIGHTQLHLHNARRVTESTIANPRIADIEEVEADCFLFVYLTHCLRESELPRYVQANPNIILRVLRVLRYFLFYDLRVYTADVLARVFLRSNAEGAA